MKIAICITTRNRPDAFDISVKEWLRFLPVNARLFVVDDASEQIYAYSDYRFQSQAGIPRAKNKCFELAYNWGADHIFLSDDDCFPLKYGWELPYINSGLNHLCFTFTGAYQYVDERSAPLIQDGVKIHELGCGCMMYFTRKCLDVVGGMDEAYGIGLYEHVDLSRRIHNSGLTPHRFLDVVGSEDLFHSMDEHGEIERSFSLHQRDQLLDKGSRYYWAQEMSKAFKPFSKTSKIKIT